MKKPLRSKFRIRLWQLHLELKRRYCPTKIESIFRAAYVRKKKSFCANAPLIVFQCVEYPFYLCLFGEIIWALRNRTSVRAEMIVLRSLSSSANSSGLRQIFHAILRWASANALSDRKWTSLYGAYANGIAYRSASLTNPWRELRIWIEAHRLWKKSQTAEELASTIVQGVRIGDLVIDSYLRFRPSPALNVKDPYLRKVFRQALRDLYKATTYFKRRRPALYLTSYTSYVQHGIAARVAANLGIHVQSFGSYLDFSKRITSNDVCHERRFGNYCIEFSRLTDQLEKLAKADLAFSARLNGHIDESIAFMKTSSYGRAKIEIPNVAGAAVIFLHDFFDSAHAYEWMLFHDFWEWVTFTINVLKGRGIRILLKPHPNEVAESSMVFDQLRSLYPTIEILPKNVSNRQLAEEGMLCAITMYGTVASEMAYLGVPAISCADNPSVSFDLPITAKSKQEYQSFLENCANLSRDLPAMRRDACAFFYMHNLNSLPEERELRDRFVRINKKMLEGAHQERWDADDILGEFHNLSVAPGFAQFIERLLESLIVGQDRRPGLTNDLDVIDGNDITHRQRNARV